MKDEAKNNKCFFLTRWPVKIFVAPILEPSEPMNFRGQIIQLAPKALGFMDKIKGHDIVCVACDPSYPIYKQAFYVLSVLVEMIKSNISNKFNGLTDLNRG